MILKASQRGGPRQLAEHLLNDRDNDHVTVSEIRGFVSQDLYGAMAETVAIAKGTRCQQPVFSLSLNPPKGVEASIGNLMDAAERAEAALGLQEQPRAIVIHEKSGRRHAHVVWSRIQADEMRAINMPYFKTRLAALSKELFLEHGWELPEGHRTNAWKNPLNFTLADWQQAQRLQLDPREIKQVFQSAWHQSDNLASFRHALEERGYYLAKGDKRGIVATDIAGEVYSVSRWSGLKTKEMRQKLGNGDNLPGLDAVKASLKSSLNRGVRELIGADRQAKTLELEPLKAELGGLVARQRAERARLTHHQKQREDRERLDRAERYRPGLGMLYDILSGRLFKLKKQAEAEAFNGWVRDRRQREQLYQVQARERGPLVERIEQMKARHREERKIFADRIAMVLSARRSQSAGREHTQTHDHSL